MYIIINSRTGLRRKQNNTSRFNIYINKRISLLKMILLSLYLYTEKHMKIQGKQLYVSVSYLPKVGGSVSSFIVSLALTCSIAFRNCILSPDSLNSAMFMSKQVHCMDTYLSTKMAAKLKIEKRGMKFKKNVLL
jgi:hypothetical protein